MNGTRQGEYVDTKYVHSGSVSEENCIGMRTAALRQLCVQVPSCRTCLSRGHACDPQRTLCFAKAQLRASLHKCQLAQLDVERFIAEWLLLPHVDSNEST